MVRTHADAVLESKVCHGCSLFPLALVQVDGLLLEGLLLEGLLVDILVERGLVESMLLDGILGERLLEERLLDLVDFVCCLTLSLHSSSPP